MPSPALLSRRAPHHDGAPITIGAASFGGNTITVIAGPCAVENRTMILEAARAVRASGAAMLRGGAYKPRTSPYAFQGLGDLEYSTKRAQARQSYQRCVDLRENFAQSH